MLVNKISQTSFNGYRHITNNAGIRVCKFNYPYDPESQEVRIEFYKSDAKDGDKPVTVINLRSSDIINFDDIPELKFEQQAAYRVIVNGKHVIDSGYYTDRQNPEKSFNLINLNALNPKVQGQTILTMVDFHRPGAYYYDFNSENTGLIGYDVDRQRTSEEVIRTFSNSGGGSLAGIESDIEMLKEMGVKKIFMTPIWGYDNKSAHHYWNKNDMQIPDSVGSIENYETMLRKLYKNGMQYVDDFAVTSYGLESLPVQYALRWANQNPQPYYWLRMRGLENGPIVLGVVPKNKENLRHRVINPDVIYNPKTQKIENNPDYNPYKETYFQIYDESQVTKEQLANKNELIMRYENTKSDNKLLINNSDDTMVCYAFEISPKEYRNRLEEFIKINKDAETPIELNSPEGTLFIGQFTHFKIGNTAEGAVFWDANKDIFKRNYYISGYDEKLISAIPDSAQRDKERELICRANCEVQDIAIQAGVYRTQFVKDVQILYTAQMLGQAKNKEEIDRLIGDVLPKEAELSEEAIKNILNGWYNLTPKGIDSREDVTIRALMKLPLDSLEFGENTVGVLATSFFTNRATSEEDIGLSRYEFYKQGSGVYAPYHLTYHYVDSLYETKIKDFAYEVIEKVNSLSKEKLLDTNGEYTEYGEYVVDMVGKDIAKYAFMKSLTGDKLETKVLSDDILKGKITYNYKKMRELTTLKALGINASGPVEEAKMLARRISSGMDELDNEDINYVAGAILKQIEGTTAYGFRIAEAMTNEAGLGLDSRLDALKDIVDMDAVRNGDLSFDEAWDQVIDFWKKYAKAIKKVNSNAYIVAEITDLEYLLRAIYGPDANVYDIDLSAVGSKYKNVPDAIREFFDETGITSEASYSYTFTDLLHIFSADAEYGNISNEGINGIKRRIEALIRDNNLDYITNLWTFADNHDKPSVLHAMALDMELFHTNNLNMDYSIDINDSSKNHYELRKRNARISILQELTNSDKFEDLPLEAMMNIDNGQYFRAVNPRSAAMSKLMRSAINDRLPDSFNKKGILKEALVDLTNGYYLTNPNNINIQTINIPALQSLDIALDEILSKTDIYLTESEKQAVINLAKQRDRVEKYAVRGDFSWTTSEGNIHAAAKELRERATYLLGNNIADYNQYSPYTISVAALLADAYNEATNGMKVESFINGSRDFIDKYTRSRVDSASSKLPYTLDSNIMQIQKAYAARDIETVIQILIQQAEYKTGVKFTEDEYNYVMKELFESATEPAVEKAIMYSSFLAALPGIPSVFYRDILGALGYDEKAKNIFLQNRNTVKYSELEEDGPLKEYRTKIFNTFRDVMQIRSVEGMEALNGGTPYLLDTQDSDTMAMLYQKDDDVAITILNAHGIDPHNRVEYDENISKNAENAVDSINNNNKYVPVQEKVELDEVLLPASIALAVGTVFVNIATKDKAEYIISKMENGLYRLARKDNKKIILNGDTAKHGTMFLKKLSKLPFKGKNVNRQYNIVFNPYQHAQSNETGKKLFVVSI